MLKLDAEALKTVAGTAAKAKHLRDEVMLPGGLG